MLNIGLRQIPNQSISVTLNSNFFDIVIKQAFDTMYVTLSINSLLILNSVRAVPNAPLIPYEYLQTGNFIFLTANNDIPFYTQFGVTQSLVYATATELAEIEATPVVYRDHSDVSQG
jgi:hypothetical protein